MIVFCDGIVLVAMPSTTLTSAYLIDCARSCGATEESVKYCAEDGNWFEKEGLEWTDYTPCLDIQVL